MFPLELSWLPIPGTGGACPLHPFIFADDFGLADSPFDFDGDGLVDFDDFFIFADHFGKDTGGS